GNDTIGDNTTETPTEEDNNVTTETPNEGETPATNETGTKNDTPGFGFVFGLVGLLAVVYLVRRNN
ncbi:MAG: PGF-CTERM sorting domain-containing protein, partial [Methanosarcina sp.]